MRRPVVGTMTLSVTLLARGGPVRLGGPGDEARALEEVADEEERESGEGEEGVAHERAGY
jgi:hypothetical protein